MVAGIQEVTYCILCYHIKPEIHIIHLVLHLDKLPDDFVLAGDCSTLNKLSGLSQGEQALHRPNRLCIYVCVCVCMRTYICVGWGGGGVTILC